MWFSFHAAHTSFYVPFPAGMPPSFLPPSYTTNALDRLDRGRSAWQAARAVFNIAQLKFSFAIQDIAAAQQAVEAAGARIQADVDSRYKDERDLQWACQAFAAHAAEAVQLWWSLRCAFVMFQCLRCSPLLILMHQRRAAAQVRRRLLQRRGLLRPAFARISCLVAARRQLHSWPSRHKCPAHGRCSLGDGSSSVVCSSSMFSRRFDCLQLACLKFAQLAPRASCTKLQSNTFTPFDARAQFCSAQSVYSSTHDRRCCAQPSSNRHGRFP